jgi:hypothetical protein
MKMPDAKGLMSTRAPLLCAVCLLNVALLAAGCAKARAESAPDGPPLSAPEPPARVLAPVEEPLPATAAVPDTPAPAPTRAPSRPPARRAEAAEPPRQEQPAPAPAAATPPPDPVPAETRELRAAPSANTAAAERNVRDLLARASRDINRVDYTRLSGAGREQYDQSKRFSQQAEQALRDRNFTFAATLADKAATLAAELLR